MATGTTAVQNHLARWSLPSTLQRPLMPSQFSARCGRRVAKGSLRQLPVVNQYRAVCSVDQRIYSVSCFVIQLRPSGYEITNWRVATIQQHCTRSHRDGVLIKSTSLCCIQAAAFNRTGIAEQSHDAPLGDVNSLFPVAMLKYLYVNLVLLCHMSI